ncbi:hypothetical protein MED222_05500 [Vibrio sp. MED222]|nr:hypothetical protein MED222_05500 [Vibrio sp. MED222]
MKDLYALKFEERYHQVFHQSGYRLLNHAYTNIVQQKTQAIYSVHLAHFFQSNSLHQKTLLLISLYRNKSGLYHLIFQDLRYFHMHRFVFVNQQSQ